MMIRKKYTAFCFLLPMLFTMGCGEEPASEESGMVENLENVKNESVLVSMKSLAKDSLSEDVIENPETKKKAEKLKAERVDKLTEKVNASPFKGSSDDEIKQELEAELKKYQESCDTAVVNLIFEQMAYDAVLSFFKQREVAYCKSYFKNIQKAKKDCNH